MQEIITEILERLGFPTKNVEKLVETLQSLQVSEDDVIGIAALTNSEQIIGYSIYQHIFFSEDGREPDCNKLKICFLFSRPDIVAKLKGGE